MDRQRIVFLSASAGGYGAENALLDLVRTLPSDLEPIVLVPEAGPLVESLSESRIEYRIAPIAVLDRRYFHPIRIFLYAALAFKSFISLVALFKQLKPSVVHTNNVLILPGAFAAKFLGIPHVWHVREIIKDHHLHHLLWRIWRRIILTCSASVICISSAVRNQFDSQKKVVVIHDGIDTEAFRPLRRQAPVAGRQSTDLVIATVGRIEQRRKGQDIFVEAARIALQTRGNLRFVIVGHERDTVPDAPRDLHALAADSALETKIEFQGFIARKEMPDMMNEIDVLVLCSKQPEGLGIVLLEAMACEKVVISFAEGGPLDIVTDHVNGLLTPPGNTDGLARAIGECADNSELREQLGKAGRKTVIESFRCELTAQEMAKVFRQVHRGHR